MAIDVVDVLDRLNDLEYMIKKNLSNYLRFAIMQADELRISAAVSTYRWFDSHGANIIRQLREKINQANFSQWMLTDMMESIDACIQLGNIANQRDLSIPENMDMVLQWCRETLPSLKTAFNQLE